MQSFRLLNHHTLWLNDSVECLLDDLSCSAFRRGQIQQTPAVQLSLELLLMCLDSEMLLSPDVLMLTVPTVSESIIKSFIIGRQVVSQQITHIHISHSLRLEQAVAWSAIIARQTGGFCNYPARPL